MIVMYVCPFVRLFVWCSFPSCVGEIRTAVAPIAPIPLSGEWNMKKPIRIQR